MRQRRLVLLGAFLVATTGCTATAAPAAPVSTDQCRAPELPPVQAGLHLIGDREPPVPYSSTPPTSGWHRSGVGGPGVATDVLSEPVQVGLLEEGLVVITHGEIDDAAHAALRDLARDHPSSVAVTPYGSLADGQVVAAGWGVLQRCDGVDTEALRRFVDFYADRENLEGTHDDSA